MKYRIPLTYGLFNFLENEKEPINEFISINKKAVLMNDILLAKSFIIIYDSLKYFSFKYTELKDIIGDLRLLNEELRRDVNNLKSSIAWIAKDRIDLFVNQNRSTIIFIVKEYLNQYNKKLGFEFNSSDEVELLL